MPRAPITTSAPMVTCGMIVVPAPMPAARTDHRIGADADPLAQFGVGRDHRRRVNAGIVHRPVVEQRGQFRQRQARVGGGNDDGGTKGTRWNRTLGRNQDRLRLAARKRRGGVRAEGKRQVGRPVGARRMHQAVDLDCAIAFEPSRERLCDVLDTHEFLL